MSAWKKGFSQTNNFGYWYSTSTKHPRQTFPWCSPNQINLYNQGWVMLENETFFNVLTQQTTNDLSSLPGFVGRAPTPTNQSSSSMPPPPPSPPSPTTTTTTTTTSDQHQCGQSSGDVQHCSPKNITNLADLARQRRPARNARPRATKNEL